MGKKVINQAQFTTAAEHNLKQRIFTALSNKSQLNDHATKKKKKAAILLLHKRLEKEINNDKSVLSWRRERTKKLREIFVSGSKVLILSILTQGKRE